MRHIGQRMSKGRELPVEQSDDARLSGVEHEIPDPVISMDKAGHVVIRNVLGKPGDQTLHVDVFSRTRELPLTAPAADLPRKEIAVVCRKSPRPIA